MATATAAGLRTQVCRNLTSLSNKAPQRRVAAFWSPSHSRKISLHRSVVPNTRCHDPILGAFNQKRSYNSNVYATDDGPSTLNLVLRLVAGVTFITGVCVTGAWYWYTPELRKYPKSVRKKLRNGWYARELHHDLERAVDEFRSATDELLALRAPGTDLKPDSPHVIGVMAQLAQTLVMSGRINEAAEVYESAFAALIPEEQLDVRSDLSPPSTRDAADRHTRAVGIAQHLGDLLTESGRIAEAERYYVWSVRRLLTRDREETTQSDVRLQTEDADAFSTFVLPPWTTPRDVGASVEALATFYAQTRKRPSLAIPLYLRAISLLEKHNHCHAAVLHNNVAEAYAALNRFAEARAWIEKGIEIANSKTKTGDKPVDTTECEEACGALLFNSAMISEFLNETVAAKQIYQKTKLYAKQHNLSNTLLECDHALARLKEK